MLRPCPIREQIATEDLEMASSGRPHRAISHPDSAAQQLSTSAAPRHQDATK